MSSVPLSLTAPNYATRPIAAGKLLTEHPSLDEDDSVIHNLHVCGSLPDICALPKDDVGLLASVFSAGAALWWGISSNTRWQLLSGCAGPKLRVAVNRTLLWSKPQRDSYARNQSQLWPNQCHPSWLRESPKQLRCEAWFFKIRSLTILKCQVHICLNSPIAARFSDSPQIHECGDLTCQVAKRWLQPTRGGKQLRSMGWDVLGDNHSTRLILYTVEVYMV